MVPSWTTTSNPVPSLSSLPPPPPLSSGPEPVTMNESTTPSPLVDDHIVAPSSPPHMRDLIEIMVRAAPIVAPSSNGTPAIVSIHPMVTRQRDGTCPPIVMIATKHPLPASLLASHDSLPMEPTCFSTANKDPEWRNVKCIEFNALLRN
uniref:Uncharacterized protein n=1 Tax=Nelumbo nucifera TaxID=4432 RepID=A0A822YUS4_NELNU|nr:TPA_asm: hypothetical protein HUJ06_005136 [Nelumbo nucifera]